MPPGWGSALRGAFRGSPTPPVEPKHLATQPSVTSPLRPVGLRAGGCSPWFSFPGPLSLRSSPSSPSLSASVFTRLHRCAKYCGQVGVHRWFISPHPLFPSAAERHPCLSVSIRGYIFRFPTAPRLLPFLCFLLFKTALPHSPLPHSISHHQCAQWFSFQCLSAPVSLQNWTLNVGYWMFKTAPPAHSRDGSATTPLA